MGSAGDKERMMGENSKIEWTDHTFNPWVGCVKVSPGCKHCYAEVQMTRNPRWANTWGVKGERLITSDSYWRKPSTWNHMAFLHGEPFFVFCGSLCDVFEERPELDEPRQRLWKLIDKTPWLIWLLLTKRPENIRRMIPVNWLDNKRPNNVWYGTSIENQDYTHRLDALCNIPAVRRFVSAEPLLGPLNIRDWLSQDLISWVIAGGESQKKCRPMDAEWALDLRLQCLGKDTAFFMKQLGGFPYKRDSLEDFPEVLRIRERPGPNPF